MCVLHGGKKSKTKSGTISWLSLETKVEPGQRGGQVMSGIGVEAAPSRRGLRWFTTKPSGFLVEPQNQDQSLGGRRRDPSMSSDFEAEDTRRDRKACVEFKRGAVVGHSSDGVTMRIPKVPLGGVYITFI
jgi:hypothetical protein